MDNKGFSLMEVMIAVSIFIIVTILAVNVFSMAKQTSAKASNLAEIIQNSRVALDRMSRECRQASSLITNLDPIIPSHEIFFQDGHDLNKITYIKYYIDGTNLMREDIFYYFTTDPSTYVYYNAIGASSNSPEANISAQIIGEYFDSMDITNNNGLLNIEFSLTKNSAEHEISTDVFIRNW
jgi:prepilin-type N-terminal cleavage/methylation domain-containing protein